MNNAAVELDKGVVLAKRLFQIRLGQSGILSVIFYEIVSHCNCQINLLILQ